MSDCLLSSAPFLLGSAARMTVACAGPDGAYADPIELRLRTLDPAGTVTTYTYPDAAEIIRDAIGHFRADIPLPLAGAWYWRWEAGQPSVGVAEGRLDVLPSRFAME